jgi:DNA ligase 1
MKDFAALYHRIDAATGTTHKNEAIQDYLRAAIADESRHASAAWAVYFLAGGKPRQTVATKLLRQLALDATGLPEWLIDESYENVGDLAETLTLLLPPPQASEDLPLDVWMNDRLLRLRAMDEAERFANLRQWVEMLPTSERLPFFKLITSALRVGVSQRQVVQALAATTGVDHKEMAQRMMGYTQSARLLGAEDFRALVRPVAEGDAETRVPGQPYPFFLAQPLQVALDDMPNALGPVADWLIEWKFDGIRGQYINRDGQWWLWSRGEELVSDSFPEMAALAKYLPDGTTLDGEIVVVGADAAVEVVDAVVDIKPFAILQQRLGRKTLTSKILKEAPVALIAYDILEQDGADIRTLAQSERRARLVALVEAARARAAAEGASLPVRLSPALTGPDWPAVATLRENARMIGAEGMMLKGAASAYGLGRRKAGPGANDLWWKWKLNPMSVDAVLIYAQRGSGRRSGVYSDYTFAVWSGPPEDRARTLVPFAKAYSGLTDDEMRQVDSEIRRTTVETFGPVRSVKPTMVFELGFEGIALSKRHKSGVATRFPRMLRWRHDKPVAEADTLDGLRALLPAKAREG